MHFVSQAVMIGSCNVSEVWVPGLVVNGDIEVDVYAIIASQHLPGEVITSQQL